MTISLLTFISVLPYIVIPVYLEMFLRRIDKTFVSTLRSFYLLVIAVGILSLHQGGTFLSFAVSVASTLLLLFLVLRFERFSKIRPETNKLKDIYKEVFDHIGDGLLVYEVSGHNLGTSLTASNLLGLTVSQMMEMEFETLFGQEIAPMFLKGVSKVDLECMGHNKVWVTAIFRSVLIDGTRMLLVSLTDISQRKEAENKLSASYKETMVKKNHLTNLLDTLPVASMYLEAVLDESIALYDLKVSYMSPLVKTWLKIEQPVTVNDCKLGTVDEWIELVDRTKPLSEQVLSEMSTLEGQRFCISVQQPQLFCYSITISPL